MEKPFYLYCLLEGSLVMREDLLEKNKRGSRYTVHTLIHSPSTTGKGTLFCGLADGTIRLWDMESYICYKTVAARRGGIRKLVLCALGNRRYLISATRIEICIRNLKNIDDPILCIAIEDLIPEHLKLDSNSDKSQHKKENFLTSSLIAWPLEESKMMIGVGTGGRGNSLFFLEVDLKLPASHHTATDNGKPPRAWKTTQEFKHKNDVTALAIYFHRQKPILATGGTYPVVRLYDLQTREQKKEFKKLHYSAITALAFNRDGRYVCSSSSDDTIIIWNTRNGAHYHLREHLSNVNCLQLGEVNGVEVLVSGGDDGLVIIWNLAGIWKTKTELRPATMININAQISSLLLIPQPGHSLLAVGDNLGLISVWEILTEPSPDGTVVISFKKPATKKLNTTYDLQIQGCRIPLAKLHPESDLGTANPKSKKEDQEILRQYGAIIDDTAKKAWEGMLNRLNQLQEEEE